MVVETRKKCEKETLKSCFQKFQKCKSIKTEPGLWELQKK